MKKRIKTKEINHIVEIAKSIEINAEFDKEDNAFDFQFFSPKGQDFNFRVDAGEDLNSFEKNLYDYYENFDPEEETIMWAKNVGLGKRGVPNSLRALLDDMEWCEKKMLEFYNLL